MLESTLITNYTIHAMKKVISIIAIPLFAVACTPSEPKNSLKNSGFEQEHPKNQAKGWYAGQHAGEDAYIMQLDSNIFFEGKSSFGIEQYKEQVYAVVEQSVRIPKGKHKKFIFSAMLKTENVEPGEGWKLVVNCREEDGYIAKQYQSSIALTATTDWQKVTIEADIPENTIKIDVGAMLQSKGKAWIDNANLIIDPVKNK